MAAAVYDFFMTPGGIVVRSLWRAPYVQCMTTTRHPGLERASDFTEALGALPAASWISIGRAAMARRASDAYRTAHLLMEALLADHALLMEAWVVRDGVETAVYYATVGIRLSPRDADALEWGRAVCESAALALLLGDALPVADFEQLYSAPSATLIRAEYAQRAV